MAHELKAFGMALFVILILLGLTLAVLSDSFIRREHRRIMLLIVVLSLSLIAQNILEYR